MSRYRRQICLPEWGEEGQARLGRTRILVVGLGGLGSPAALYLAAAGVGTLGLADFDTVELSNLHRQILHDTESARSRQGKLESAERRLRALNPEVKLVPHSAGVTAENAAPLVGSYDIVVDGSDNFSTRYLLNDACALARVPLVHGSLYQFEGLMAVFAPHLGGPCYRCLHPEPPPTGAVPGCAEAGVLGALCGVVGSWQALAALRLAAGVGAPPLGKLTRYDALNDEWLTLRLARDPACPLCGDAPVITSIDAARYPGSACTPAAPDEETDTLAGADLVVDVREPAETATGTARGAHLIPLAQWETRAPVEVPRTGKVVVYCARGLRSLQAVRALRSRGWTNVVSLRGGFQAGSEA
jgi:adenylyltransferase/sulfurtransferase